MTERPATKIERRRRSTTYRCIVDHALSVPAMVSHRSTVDEALSAPLFVAFTGYPRSGTTLVAQVLNAHPDALVSLEVDVMSHLRWRFSRRQLLALIAKRDRDWDRQGRQWQGYEYRIESGWQCRYRRLLVVGDKKSAATALQIESDPSRVDALAARMSTPMRWIHVVRNPFDIVATMTQRSNVSPEHAIGVVERMARGTALVAARAGVDAVLDVHLEDLVAEPRARVGALCEHLGLEVDERHIDACAAALFASARSTRDAVEWAPRLRERLDALVAEHPWFARYEL